MKIEWQKVSGHGITVMQEGKSIKEFKGLGNFLQKNFF